MLRWLNEKLAAARHRKSLREALVSGDANAFPRRFAERESAAPEVAALLVEAAQRGTPRVCEALLDAGADPNLLVWARSISPTGAILRHGSEELVDRLLATGRVDPNARAFHWDMDRRLPVEIAAERPDILGKLLRAVPHSDALLWRGLGAAARWGTTESIDVLLGAGANIRTKESPRHYRGWFTRDNGAGDPIYFALLGSAYDESGKGGRAAKMIAHLIGRGADPNSPGAQAAAILAMERGFSRVIEALEGAEGPMRHSSGAG
jgi:hypothetical protein